jgi:uncharacterized membrane protein YeaQ/YmgE (transglycosylase-associated protein family)
MSPANFFSIVVWVVTGAVAGYLASLMLRAERQGCFINIALGIAGAFVGAFVLRSFFPNVFSLFGTEGVGGLLSQMVHAVIGAVILLVIAELVLPGQQLGVRGERSSRRRSRRRR